MVAKEESREFYCGRSVRAHSSVTQFYAGVHGDITLCSFKKTLPLMTVVYRIATSFWILCTYTE